MFCRRIIHKIFKAMQKDTSDTASVITINTVNNNNHGSNNSNNLIIPSWPINLRDKIVRTFNRAVDEEAAHRFFDRHDWPHGLREIIYRDCKKVPLRFYVADDSGSMSSKDGTRIVKQTNGKYVYVFTF